MEWYTLEVATTKAGCRLTWPLQPQWQHWGALALAQDSEVVDCDETGMYGAEDAWHLDTGACAVQVVCEEVETVLENIVSG